jgi:hypothetical protein
MGKQLIDVLHKYDMESLHAYCDEYDVLFPQDDKDAACSALAEKLLHDHVLEQRMGILDDETLQGLHALMNGEKADDPDILDHLDGLDLVYCCHEKEWIVPDEVKALTAIETKAWNQDRIDRVWLMQCLTIVQHEWADVPMQVMEELFHQNPQVSAKADLKRLFQDIPVSEIPCVMIGDAFVIRGWRSSEVFASYREKQKKYPFYMPSMDEVEDLYRNDFDTRSSFGRTVKEWFLKNGAEEDDLVLLMHEMWNDMNYGHAETEIIKEAESMITFDDTKEEEQFRRMMHDWYIHVQRLDMRGNSLSSKSKK